MSAPQMKEGPASSMLRAMFAGFGSLMSVMDRVRNKPAAEAPADTKAPAAATTPAPEEAAAPKDIAAPETVAAETIAEPETVAAPEAAPVPKPEPAAVAPEPVAAPEPAAVAPEPVAAPEPAAVVTETSAAPEAAGALPLANYDELTVASLRARLRNLSNDDLNQLMTYERARQNRPEVIKMFQNRLIKMTTGMPKLEE
jgi:outer membrane biosynthesis protein TonB